MKTKFSEEHNWSSREEKNSDSYRGSPKRPPSGPQRPIEKMPTQLEAVVISNNSSDRHTRCRLLSDYYVTAPQEVMASLHY